MKKLLCLLPAFFAFNAHAIELTNFNELKSAIQGGNNINIVIFIDQCRPHAKSAEPITVTGALRPNSFMIVNDQISASDLHFTRNKPNYKDRSVFEFITYQFSANNEMILYTQTLNVENYSPLGIKRQLNCSVGSSVKLFSDATKAGLMLIDK